MDRRPHSSTMSRSHSRGHALRYILRIHHMTQELHFSLIEMILRKLSVQVVVLEFLETVSMFCRCSSSDLLYIMISSKYTATKSSKNSRNASFISAWNTLGALQVQTALLRIKRSVPCSYASSWVIFFFHPYLIVPTAQVKIREVPCASKAIKYLVYTRQWTPILDSLFSKPCSPDTFESIHPSLL
jgi:hypothetical protein